MSKTTKERTELGRPAKKSSPKRNLGANTTASPDKATQTFAASTSADAKGDRVVALMARFTANPGHREVVARLINDYARHVRRAAGTKLFEPATLQGDAHSFVVYEQYADRAAFEAHINDPLNASFNRALAPHILGAGSELEFFNLTA